MKHEVPVLFVLIYSILGITTGFASFGALFFAVIITASLIFIVKFNE